MMTQTKQPAISVIMSVYNSEKYLVEAIDSIINQTFTDFEFIIINDASTDGSLRLIKMYTDPRIVLVENELNLGLTKSLNQGLRIAKGKYIARMDADDISLPKRLETQFRFMEQNPDIGLCGSWIECFGKEKKTFVWKFPQKHNEITACLFFIVVFAHPTMIIRNGIQELIYNEEFQVAQDYELWHRLLKIMKGANLPDVLLRYRLVDTSTGALQSEKQRDNVVKVKRRMLTDLGVINSEQDDEVFSDLLVNEWPNDKTLFASAIHRFEAVIKGNQQLKSFDEKLFSREVGKFSFQKCTSLKSLSLYRIYQKSALFHYYKPSLNLTFRLYAKACLNWFKN